MARTINVNIPRTTIGMGAINSIGDMAKGFSAGKILILTDAGIARTGIIDTIKALLAKAGLNFEVFDGCKEEPPIPLLVEIAKKVKDGSYDLLIGVGGGSVMDTAKAVSVIALSGMTMSAYTGTRAHDKIAGKIIPKILVPTTAGTGAEWSVNTALYDHEGNRTYIVRAWENVADRVIIDPELTLKLPQRVTADTGFDALSHAIEAFCSANANVFSDMMAGTAIKMVSQNVRQAYTKGQLNTEARYNMAVAAALAMNAMSASGGGLNHFTSEHIGPRAHTSHGTTLATTLPAIMEFHLIAIPEKLARIAELMGENVSGLPVLEAAGKAIEAVKKLIKDLNLPQSLSAIGIKETDIPEIAHACFEATKNVIATSNPRDATEEDIIRILKAAL